MRPPGAGTPTGKTATKTKSKYRNNPVFITPAGEFVRRGHPGPKTQVFDSEKEYRRYLVLREWQAAGLISMLKPHRNFPLHSIGGEKVSAYEADFTYILNGRLVVEDVKSSFTRMNPVYKLKKKWMKAEYGIDITEV